MKGLISPSTLQEDSKEWREREDTSSTKSQHERLLKVPDVEEGHQFVVPRRKHQPIVAPIGVEDHASLGFLRYFETLNDFLILNGPDD